MPIRKVSGRLHASVVLDGWSWVGRCGVPAEAKSMFRAGILSASVTTDSLTGVSGCSGDRICVHSVPVQRGVMEEHRILIHKQCLQSPGHLSPEWVHGSCLPSKGLSFLVCEIPVTEARVALPGALRTTWGGGRLWAPCGSAVPVIKIQWSNSPPHLCVYYFSGSLSDKRFLFTSNGKDHAFLKDLII